MASTTQMDVNLSELLLGPSREEGTLPSLKGHEEGLACLKSEIEPQGPCSQHLLLKPESCLLYCFQHISSTSVTLQEMSPRGKEFSWIPDSQIS